MKLGSVFVVWFLIMIGPVALISLWTQRNLDFWLSQWNHHAVHVPYWASFLATFILNGVVLAGNIVGEIVRLAM